ncbi:MAG: Fe-S cluster assembly transcriptional regulator IscR, partial [Gammaproteobacteria bacterium HGW-Gammaproteobacteria-6]
MTQILGNCIIAPNRNAWCRPMRLTTKGRYA